MVLPLIPLLIGGTVASAVINSIKKKKTQGAYRTGGHYRRRRSTRTHRRRVRKHR